MTIGYEIKKKSFNKPTCYFLRRRVVVDWLTETSGNLQSCFRIKRHRVGLRLIFAPLRNRIVGWVAQSV